MVLRFASEDLWKDREFDPETAEGSLTLMNALLDWLEHQGISRDEIFKTLPFDPIDLTKLDYKMMFPEYKRLLYRVHALWGGNDLGLKYGSEFRFTSFGVIGHAAITSETFKTYMEIFTKYFSLKVKLLRYEAEFDKSRLTVRMFSVTPDPLISRFQIDAGLSAAQTLIRTIHEAPVRVTVNVKYAPDELRSEYEKIFPGGISFNQAEYSIIFDDIQIEYPMPFANPINSQLGLKYCEIERNSQTSITEEEPNSATEILRQVQKAVADELAGPPSLLQLAKSLGLSERSLRRVIAESGLTYRQILMNHRAEHASRSLVHSDRPISKIAADLGYESAANFSRAFKKWFGLSPMQYRKNYSEK